MAEQAAEGAHERFDMELCLGEGASGVVFRALDTMHNMTVAVKVLTRLDPSSLLRFKSEFRGLANISHPNLLQLYDLVARGHEWLLSMELIEGGDFLSYVRPLAADAVAALAPLEVRGSLHTMTMTPGALPVTESAPLVLKNPALGPLHEQRLRAALLQLCEGLKALHDRHKLHRDLKPANVLVSEADERVVICDFGLVVEGYGVPQLTGGYPLNDNARVGSLRHSDKQGAYSGSLQGSSQGEVAGTVAYMSPEQALGKPLDTASDWYAVGVMIYQAIANELPFDGRLRFEEMVKQRNERPPPDVRTVVPDAPEDLSLLAKDLMALEPAARPGYAEVVRRLRADGADTREHVAADSALIGREAQLLALRQAFLRARSGQGTLVMVSGRSGMGKSALMRTFLHELAQRDGAVVLASRCYEREDLPYKAFDPLLDALSTFLMTLEQTSLESLLPAGASSLVRLFPVLSRVPAFALRELDSGLPKDAQEQKRLAFGALRELLGTLAHQYPLVLYIDDLQWGDLDSGPLFTELLRAPAPALLLVCAHRSEDEHESALLKALASTHLVEAGVVEPVHIELTPLPDDDTRRLARALLDDDTEGGAGAERIVREAGGNPFFVSELASYMRQAGPLAASDIALDTVIEARLHALPQESRHLLSVIAVAGRPERRHIINAAAQLGGKSYQALRLLEQQSLVHSSGASAQDKLEAYHDRIRETAYRLLASEPRRALHEKLAHALEAKGDGDAEALLRHFKHADKHKRAGEYALLAAEKAERALAFQRAALLYQEARELLEPEGEQCRSLDERLGNALMLAGHGVAAAAAFFSALKGASSERAMELRSLGTIQLLRAGQVNRAFHELSAAEHILRMRTPVKTLQAVAMLLWRRLQIRLLGLKLRIPATPPTRELTQRMDMLWGIGGALGAIDQLRSNVYQAEHLLLAIKSGDLYRYARALAMESTVHGTSNKRPEQTQRVIDQGLVVGGRSGNHHALSAVKGTAGVCRMLEGRFEEAVRLTREAQYIVRHHLQGLLAWDRVVMELFELRAQAMLGNVKELSERVPELLRDADVRGDLYAAVSARTSHFAWAWLGRDLPDQALAQVQLADEKWVQDGYHLQHWYATQALAEVALYRDDVSAASARLSREWKSQRLMRSKIQFTRAELLYLRARLSLAEARKSGQRAPLAQVRADIAALRREKQPWITAHADLLAACSCSFDDRARTQQLLRETEGQFLAVDMRLMAAVCRYRLGQLSEGAQAKQLVNEGAARMATLGVTSAKGFARMLAPGFPGLDV